MLIVIVVHENACITIPFSRHVEVYDYTLIVLHCDNTDYWEGKKRGERSLLPIHIKIFVVIFNMQFQLVENPSQNLAGVIFVVGINMSRALKTAICYYMKCNARYDL